MWWLLLPLAVFGALVIVHARVVERLERSKRAIQFYERGVARLEDRWMGTGESGERFRNPATSMPKISICSAKARSSSCCPPLERAPARTLWPAGCSRPHPRTKSPRGTKPFESFARCSICARIWPCSAPPSVRDLDPDAAARWGEAPEVRFPAGARYIAPLFGAAMVISFGLYMADIFTRTPFLAVLLAGTGLRVLSGPTNLCGWPRRSTRRPTIWCCSRNFSQRLENETFHAPLLQQLHARLKARSHS